MSQLLIIKCTCSFLPVAGDKRDGVALIYELYRRLCLGLSYSKLIRYYLNYVHIYDILLDYSVYSAYASALLTARRQP